MVRGGPEALKRRDIEPTSAGTVEPDGATARLKQAVAVMLALTREVAVLTGGPGCGKTFTVRSVVELARARNAKVVARRAGPAEHCRLRPHIGPIGTLSSFPLCCQGPTYASVIKLRSTALIATSRGTRLT